MTYIEISPKSSRAYGKGCHGCVTHKRDIMLSFFTKELDTLKESFTDVFLTQEDAKQLHKDFGEKIKQNEEETL